MTSNFFFSLPTSSTSRKPPEVGELDFFNNEMNKQYFKAHRTIESNHVSLIMHYESIQK